MRKVWLAVLFLFVSTAAYALTPAQLTALKADIAANTTAIPAGVQDCNNYVGQLVNALPNTGDVNICLARFYNTVSSPAFTVWKTAVNLGEIGDAMVATEIAGLTSLNTDRLALMAQYSPTGINPSLADRRAFFDDIFSGAGGAGTRARLLILWKRLATRAERLYATGTGSDAVPGALVFEGSVSGQDVAIARNL